MRLEFAGAIQEKLPGNRTAAEPVVRRPGVATPPVAQRRLRIALVADTHGFVDPRIVEVVNACDVVVHAGDVGSREVLDAMRPRDREVHTVRGNNDTAEKWPAHDRKTLQRLPDHVRLALPGGTLVAVHGDRVLPAARRHEKLRRLYPDARAVVYGHTHRLVCDCDTVPWVLNPGAAGRARTFGGPSCLTLEVGVRGWRVQTVRFV